jgi:hypothetical protein
MRALHRFCRNEPKIGDHDMDWTSLIGALAFFTLGIWVLLAFVSKQRVEKRLADPNSVKSTLAADKSSHGQPADV